MISIDKRVEIYNRWGDKEKLQPLNSADEMLWRDDVNSDHREWLERFIRLWDITQRKEYDDERESYN